MLSLLHFTVRQIGFAPGLWATVFLGGAIFGNRTPQICALNCGKLRLRAKHKLLIEKVSRTNVRDTMRRYLTIGSPQPHAACTNVDMSGCLNANRVRNRIAIP